MPKASPITRAIDEVLRRAVEPSMAAAGWSRRRRSWSKISERSVRVVAFHGLRGNRGVQGRATLMAGVSYPSIGEPRPAHLSVASCTHGMIHSLLHEHGDPPGVYLWFTHANDEAQVDQQAHELAWHWEHLLLPRLELFDDPRELRDQLVARDLTTEALPLCDLLGDRDWTIAVLQQHLVQARLLAGSDDPHRRSTDSGRASIYATGVTWAERLGVPLSDEDRTLALDAVEQIRSAPSLPDDDTVEHVNQIADYLGIARVPTSG